MVARSTERKEAIGEKAKISESFWHRGLASISPRLSLNSQPMLKEGPTGHIIIIQEMVHTLETGSGWKERKEKGWVGEKVAFISMDTVG